MFYFYIKGYREESGACLTKNNMFHDINTTKLLGESENSRCCQKLCDENPECGAVTWIGENNTCYMLSNMASTTVINPSIKCYIKGIIFASIN